MCWHVTGKRLGETDCHQNARVSPARTWTAEWRGFNEFEGNGTVSPPCSRQHGDESAQHANPTPPLPGKLDPALALDSRRVPIGLAIAMSQMGAGSRTSCAEGVREKSVRQGDGFIHKSHGKPKEAPSHDETHTKLSPAPASRGLLGNSLQLVLCISLEQRRRS